MAEAVLIDLVSCYILQIIRSEGDLYRGLPEACIVIIRFKTMDGAERWIHCSPIFKQADFPTPADELEYFAIPMNYLPEEGTYTCADPEHSPGGSDKVLVINVFYREPYRPLSRSNRTVVHLLLSQVGSVPVFIRKPIATCHFPGGGGGSDRLTLLPLDLPIRKRMII